MSVRKRLAGLLRLVDLEPTVPFYEDAIARIEGVVYRLAQRLDPHDPWQNLGYVTDADFIEADADGFFDLVIKEQREAMGKAFERYVDGLMVDSAQPNFVIDDVKAFFIAPVDPDPPVDIETVREVVRKAYENGQPVEPTVMAELKDYPARYVTGTAGAIPPPKDLGEKQPPWRRYACPERTATDPCVFRCGEEEIAERYALHWTTHHA